jgi:hypothetical protein
LKLLLDFHLPLLHNGLLILWSQLQFLHRQFRAVCKMLSNKRSWHAKLITRTEVPLA